MCESITDFGGTIDKFIGDAILAIFGAPNSYPDNAMRAVKASIAMAKSLKRVKVQNLLLPESGLGMGIGIHEGDAIVGNVGSSAKFDYTVIGDTVNLASRLEGITKIYKKQIIISEDVAICLDKRIKLRELDKVAVKGKSKPSTIFSVEAGLGDLNEPGYELHRKAMSMFRLRNWNLSKKYFQEVLEIFPDDFISKLYLTRCEKFLIHPPSDDWDGTFTMETK
jgi:class 3 adenylate cyclase